MAWRTSQEEVRTIVSTDKDLSIAPFLDAANELVNYVVTQDTAGILTTRMLEQVEKWLAAHFYAIHDLQYHERETQDAKGKFQGKTEMGLDATLQGQQAMVLDITGTLRKINKKDKPKATMTWLGKPVSSQTPYEQRN